MNDIPRLSWSDDEYMFVDETGLEVTFPEVVARYNSLASQHEAMLNEIEAIVTGVVPYPVLPEVQVYTKTQSASNSMDSNSKSNS